MSGRLALVAALVLLLVGAAPGAASAQTTSGPAAEVDRTEFAPGTPVTIRITGFTSRSVTVSPCGNEGRRGSSDCNISESKTAEIYPDRPAAIVVMPIAAPPVPCPCIIRVSNATNDEFAVVPVTILGHPVGPLSEAPAADAGLAVGITASAAPTNALDRVRTKLGGPARYVVRIRVRNTTTALLDDLTISASAGRTPGDDLVVIPADDPGALPPGQTWEQDLPVTLPSLVIGDVVWTAAVTGPRGTATGIETTQQRPVLLYVVALLFLVDVAVIGGRALHRRHQRRAARALAGPDAPVLDTVAVEELSEAVR